MRLLPIRLRSQQGHHPPLQRPPGSRTRLAALCYTGVAALQKASGFALLIALTRVVEPTQYGLIALLTAVGVFISVVMTLGLEPRITYACFRLESDLPEYLRKARQVSIAIPAALGLMTSSALLLTSVEHKVAWAMECLGACLLASGTTYAYAILRSRQRVARYAVLAISTLITQVSVKVTAVAFLDLGPSGWAAGDLAGGLVATVVGLRLVKEAVVTGKRGHQFSARRVLLDGLPLVPHYIAQWGLSLSDRLILAIFVSTADVGIYAALYQFAAVTSMVLSEMNRAVMPNYAREKPGSEHLHRLIWSHIRVSFCVSTVFLGFGLIGVSIILPSEYQVRDEVFPLLAIGALLYGLYFIPMNVLTLTAGVTKIVPLISLSALVVGIFMNLLLDGRIGLWGAAIATALGYLTLLVSALIFAVRTNSLRWRRLPADDLTSVVLCFSILIFILLTSIHGPIRTFAGLSAVLMGAALAFREIRTNRHASPP